MQQAAYTLIDESHKQVVHLQIGRNLLKKASPRLSDMLFEIVDHLNHGLEQVTDRAERNEIARLNLMAAQKAKAALAYSRAKKYLVTGREWLTASSWQTNYKLTLELYLETTEVAYLCGEFEQVESWVAIAVQEAKTVLDIVKVYEVKIQIMFTAMSPILPERNLWKSNATSQYTARKFVKLNRNLCLFVLKYIINKWQTC